MSICLSLPIPLCPFICLSQINLLFRFSPCRSNCPRRFHVASIGVIIAHGILIAIAAIIAVGIPITFAAIITVGIPITCGAIIGSGIVVVSDQAIARSVAPALRFTVNPVPLVRQYDVSGECRRFCTHRGMGDTGSRHPAPIRKPGVWRVKIKEWRPRRLGKNADFGSMPAMKNFMISSSFITAGAFEDYPVICISTMK